MKTEIKLTEDSLIIYAKESSPSGQEPLDWYLDALSKCEGMLRGYRAPEVVSAQADAVEPVPDAEEAVSCLASIPLQIWIVPVAKGFVAKSNAFLASSGVMDTKTDAVTDLVRVICENLAQSQIDNPGVGELVDGDLSIGLENIHNW